MKSKESILKRINKNKPAFKPLPKDFVSNYEYAEDELLTSFETNLLRAGAEVFGMNSASEATSYIKSKYKGVINFEDKEVRERYSANTAKQDLEGIEVAAIKGQFGVAENGAIWVSEKNFPHRLIPFIAQELIILLDKDHIVSNMHEAYRKIELEDIGFGIFISGPSKTADIEQSLVYGAHGPRKSTVVLYARNF